jgi:hypothetical protein
MSSNDTIVKDEVIQANQTLLQAVANGDWTTYSKYCDENTSCIESETNGSVVMGLPFHKFFFDLPAPKGVKKNVTMTDVKVHILGMSHVVLAYARLNQVFDGTSESVSKVMETRVWARTSSGWKNIHLHRSSV